MPPTLDVSAYQNLLQSFLREDLGSGDITTETTVSPAQRARGEVIAKAPLVLAGIELFAEVFRILDPATTVEIIFRDAEELIPGQIPARVNSTARALLSGERVALNLLQRLSGVATLTRQFVRAVAGTGAEILDTRKTTPGLRALEKYAVRVGGGRNHRKDLGEAVLIKENHIRLAGGVDAALLAAQAAQGRASWIEIEVTNLDELRAALAHGPDIILLDNMSPALVRQAVEQVRAHNSPRKIRTEASGGITIANVREFAEAGVDWISVGALTHSAPAVDLSFEIEPCS
ncbi:MAG TPA: carboxylating nicotinate-nucleotide diphosphorylase [Candidatus Dormibacteraeota bacterium]|nr:carboxylating nicotinate-nucleotide diphosphorylase [Candidatus Dormibacteraeota bacterium]